jgi:hypothetical protein
VPIPRRSPLRSDPRCGRCWCPVLGCSPGYTRRIGETGSLTAPSPATSSSSRRAVFTQGQRSGWRELPARGPSITTDSGGAELIALRMRIGHPARFLLARRIPESQDGVLGRDQLDLGNQGYDGGHPCTASANRKGEPIPATARVSRCERHRSRRLAPASGRTSALARLGSEGAGSRGAQRRCAGDLRGTHPEDAAGDRRCRRNRRGGASVPAEEMIGLQPHTGDLAALNSGPWAGPWAGSPRTSVPGRRHYPPGSGSDPASGQV